MILADDLTTIMAGWYKIMEEGVYRKIGKCEIDPAKTFVYVTAPEELIGRFTMSSEYFEGGDCFYGTFFGVR